MKPDNFRDIRNFWETHYYEGLPACAVETIGDLAGAGIIRDTPANLVRIRENFLKILLEAESIHGITSWASPGVADVICDRVCAGIPVELIVTPRLTGYLHQPPFREKLRALDRYSNFRVYLTDEPVLTGMTVTDRCLSLALFFKDGVTYDSRSDLVCRTAACLFWGERLFRWYRDRSVEVTSNPSPSSPPGR
jgi:predicted transcriptional regulator